MGKSLLMACALLLGAGEALADGLEVVEKQIEASMLVTGSIDIEPDGSVSGSQLDHAEKLPEGVVGLVNNAVASWRFDPVLVDGKAAKARTPMGVRVVASRVDENKYTVRLASANFGGRGPRDESVTMKPYWPPEYPHNALRNGVKGTVYLALQISRKGRVKEVVVEQVNLKVLDRESAMGRWRKELADAALTSARDWTFVPPARGDEVDAPYWLVRVPVVFSIQASDSSKYGEWEAYVPGPRRPLPWSEAAGDSAVGTDALVAGGVYPLGQGPRLLTPLGGS